VLAAVAAGQLVVVTDDADREGEGDLIVAAEAMTADQMAFLVRHTSGIVCAALGGEIADQLDLPLMVTDNTDPHRTAFTVTVDARTGVTTGISASDRVHTLRVLSACESRPADLARPGHVFPLRACAGGVLQRRGHTEAAVDLMRLAGRRPVAAISEIVCDDGRVATLSQARRFAMEHELAVCSVDDLVRFRRAVGPADPEAASRTVWPVSHARIPVGDTAFTATTYRTAGGIEHVVASLGNPATQGLLVRAHSECFTGDVLGSARCDCGPQLRASLELIASAGNGILVYLRGHEGRGIGLSPKLDAYRLQDAGHDTIDANLLLGLPVDGRSFADAAAILADLGAVDVRLLTNNPGKVHALRDAGLAVERVPLVVGATEHSRAYLQTKQKRLGHELSIAASVEKENA
jgi:3,4-dihydroxy 2-butanone 4-phosphate synthase/GTP cyclohydrolase II